MPTMFDYAPVVAPHVTSLTRSRICCAGAGPERASSYHYLLRAMPAARARVLFAGRGRRLSDLDGWMVDRSCVAAISPDAHTCRSGPCPAEAAASAAEAAAIAERPDPRRHR